MINYESAPNCPMEAGERRFWNYIEVSMECEGSVGVVTLDHSLRRISDRTIED